MAEVTQNVVIRRLDRRIYPLGRCNAVWAPLRVDARVKPGHDEKGRE